MEGCPKFSIQSPYADLLASCSPPPALPHLPFAAESWGTGHARTGPPFFSFSSRSDLPPKSWIFRHARIYTVPFFGFPCCVPTANGIYAYKIRRGILRVATSAAAQKQNWKLSKLPRKPSNRHPQKEFLVHPWALESLRGITRTIDTTEYIKPCHVGRMTICLFGDDRRRLDHVISSLTAKQSAAPRCLTDGKYLCRLEPLPLG